MEVVEVATVEVVEVAAEAVAEVVVAGRARWAVRRLPGRAVTASAPTAGIAYRTW